MPASFSQKIIEWYRLHKRSLPWRQTEDPYHIWLSEIMLQQTRVDQAMAYYHKFTSHYPTVFDLANASEDEVLKDWQGLGYYSRARNLHYTARMVATDYKGTFPRSFDGLLSLKGIGKYTAAAIASICYDQPHAVLDGNVYRVLSRVFRIDLPIDGTEGKAYFEKLAQSLMDDKNAGEYNQSIMEFGALYCKPQNPDCNNCIFAENCVAFKENKVHALPVKAKKVRQRERYFNYLVIKSNGHTFLKKRTADDIWKNLYDFPLIENEKKLPESSIPESSGWKKLFKSTNVIVQRVTAPKIHLLTHQKINATFWEINAENINLSENEGIIKIKESDLHQFPVPKLIENYLNQ